MPADNSNWIQLAQFVDATEAEGPGRRAAIWFQGCPLRCPGCCNPEMLPFEGGQSIALSEIRGRLLRAQQQHQIEGITLLGGEPFAHAEGAAMIAEFARQQSLSTMVFSGYTTTELAALPGPWPQRLLAATDVLVDGRYEAEERTQTRRWIGSKNQQLHFLSDRYSANDACWGEPNSIEIHWNGSEVVVTGFPDRDSMKAIRSWERRE